MKIVEIELLSDNLLTTEQFYTEILGLKIKEKGSNKISFHTGESILTFLKSETQQAYYHFAFNIPHNQLEEAIEWISSKIDLIPVNEHSVIADFDSWYAKSIYFYDYNGNILEFIARYQLDNYSEKVFGPSSILSISEIGVVTDDPLKTAEEFVQKDNLSYFPKGIKNEKFATLGTDEGLFIIVATGRNWYPTYIPSKKFPTGIRILNNGKLLEISL